MRSPMIISLICRCETLIELGFVFSYLNKYIGMVYIDFDEIYSFI